MQTIELSFLLDYDNYNDDGAFCNQTGNVMCSKKTKYILNPICIPSRLSFHSELFVFFQIFLFQKIGQSAHTFFIYLFH